MFCFDAVQCGVGDHLAVFAGSVVVEAKEEEELLLCILLRCRVLCATKSLTSLSKPYKIFANGSCPLILARDRLV